MNKVTARFAIASMAVVCASCATILGSSLQRVRITAPECPDAMCEVTHLNGKQTLSYLPGTALFDRGWKDVSIRCWQRSTKENSVEVGLQSTLDGWIFGNLIFGGVIGTAIDLGTGATGKLPDRFLVPLVCSG